MKNIISTDNAPKAVGPYSQGINIGNLYFFSGQIAINPETSAIIDGDVAAQTVQVLKNIDALLTSCSLTVENVIKCTVFITDMKAFSKVNAEYGKYFHTNPPARSCVEVSALPLNALVEIEVIASKN